MARKWLSEVPKATYVFAGMGIVLFAVGCFLRFWPSLTLGVLLLAGSVLRLVPPLLTDIKKGEGLLSAISATWAALFVTWCVVWLFVPAAHPPLISLTVGMVLAAGAFILAYFIWRMERRQSP
jgi:hypothetical protein